MYYDVLRIREIPLEQRAAAFQARADELRSSGDRDLAGLYAFYASLVRGEGAWVPGAPADAVARICDMVGIEPPVV